MEHWTLLIGEYTQWLFLEKRAALNSLLFHRPSGHSVQRHFFSYKKYHAIKFQAAMAVNGTIVVLHDPYPGKYADAKMLRLSKLEEDLQNLNNRLEIPNAERFIFYCDKGYGKSLQVVPPFKNPQPGEI